MMSDAEALAAIEALAAVPEHDDPPPVGVDIYLLDVAADPIWQLPDGAADDPGFLGALAELAFAGDPSVTPLGDDPDEVDDIGHGDYDEDDEDGDHAE